MIMPTHDSLIHQEYSRAAMTSSRLTPISSRLTGIDRQTLRNPADFLGNDDMFRQLPQAKPIPRYTGHIPGKSIPHRLCISILA
jgi:hypothetical protein